MAEEKHGDCHCQYPTKVPTDIRCYYLSIAQFFVFALLNRLIQKSVRRWLYFSVARAPKLIDATRKTSAFRYACVVPG